MANLYNKQAELYVETRPSYPPELFEFIASKTPNHDLAWDVGTGSGQAALSIAKIYKNVIATDASAEQLAHAPKLPNIRYHHTLSTMTIDELAHDIAPKGTVDVVTVAMAVHWFDLPAFYQQVNWVLRKPHGVIAVWCYTMPQVNDSVDTVFWHMYSNSVSFWAPTHARKMVEDEYKSLDFPFGPVKGLDHTGPMKFEAKKLMGLDVYLTYIRSWSAYQLALEKGVELLSEEVIEDFRRAWGEDGSSPKLVRFPVHLRIGKVVN
ncbi:uncharacterized protein LOC143882120 [Tasmannia lanceolata]|uniref:uncharacterized protein LOC143882120 n=1 Tax=Tasmannia lanceolata TaxID=3420 RepID=UPI0040649FA0